MRGEANEVRFMFRGVTVDDRTRDYVEKRVRQLDKMLEKVLKRNVEIDMDKKGKFRVEVMIETDRSLFRARDVSESIEGSADLAVDEIKTQITRNKDKVWRKIMKGARAIKEKMSFDKNSQE